MQNPDLSQLSASDRTLLDSLNPQARTETCNRLAAVQQVAAAPKGTKNTVMTRLADELGVTIGGVGSFCLNYRKSGLTAILPRDALKQSPAPAPRSLGRQPA